MSGRQSGAAGSLRYDVEPTCSASRKVTRHGAQSRVAGKQWCHVTLAQWDNPLHHDLSEALKG